jgi:hypothetical protein
LKLATANKGLFLLELFLSKRARKREAHFYGLKKFNLSVVWAMGIFAFPAKNYAEFLHEPLLPASPLGEGFFF